MHIGIKRDIDFIRLITVTMEGFLSEYLYECFMPANIRHNNNNNKNTKDLLDVGCLLNWIGSLTVNSLNKKDAYLSHIICVLLNRFFLVLDHRLEPSRIDVFFLA